MKGPGYQALAKPWLLSLALFVVVWQWGALPAQMGGNIAFADPSSKVHVLSDRHIFIENDGDVHLVYGTSGNNTCTVENGAKAHFLHALGKNVVYLKTPMTQCVVFRSGAMVTIQNEQDGSFVKLPATVQMQTLWFGAIAKPLQIKGDKVFLGDQEIGLNPQPITNDDEPWPFDVVSTLPAENASHVSVNTYIAIRFNSLLHYDTIIPENFHLKEAVSQEPVPFTLERYFMNVTITPNRPFSHGIEYVLTVDEGVMNTRQDPLTGGFSMRFRTDSFPVELLFLRLNPEHESGEHMVIPFGNAGEMHFSWVPPDVFLMGAEGDDNSYDWKSKPMHEVFLNKGFWMGQFEVTQAQWKEIMGNNPSFWQGERVPDGVESDKLPVEQVSWDDVDEFIAALNAREAQAGSGIRFSLPTEAQWEYAASGGVADQKYAGGNDLDLVGWYEGNSGATPHEVGKKAPNGFNLYDMSGNVNEWCEDIHSPSYYKYSPYKNPSNSEGSARFRVVRGGTWRVSHKKSRVVLRQYAGHGGINQDLGFRLVMHRQ